MNEFESLKDMVRLSRHIVYATVNEDGTPHNSPMFYIPNATLKKVYMGTHPDSLHAQNIRRTGKAFGVVTGIVSGKGRGLYMRIDHFHEAMEDELIEALDAHNTARARLGKERLTTDYYQAPNQQRMYVGNIVELSVNDVIRDSQGYIEQDIRCAYNSDELSL